MKRQRSWLVGFCLLGLLTSGLTRTSNCLADQEMRSWADKSGKNKIKAKFLKLEDDVVTLEKADGEEVEIELKKLSAADQKYAADAAKESDDSPFKSKSDDPFKTKPKGTTPKKSTESDADSTVDLTKTRKVKADLSSAETIALTAPSDTWQVEVSSAGSPSVGKIKPIPIPNKSNFFEHISGLAVTRGDKPKKAVVGFLLEKHGEVGVARIAICDFSTGKSGTPAFAPSNMTPVAIHDDGSQVLMRSKEFGFGKQDRLEVWIPKGKKIAKIIEWIPYDSEDGHGRDVLWAEFLNPETLGTCNGNGKVVFWKYPEIEAVYQFETAGGAVPGLSVDRKLLAYSNGKELGILDVEKKEVIAQQPTPIALQWPYMAFSPSGARVGCVAFDKVLVWDLATGNHEQTVACTGLNIHGSVDFPDDNYMLVGKQYLIDLQNQVKLWTYNGAEQVKSIGGVTYFAASDGEKKPGALISAQIPHPAAKEILKKSLTDPELFVLKAGTTVRIDVNGIADPAQRERVAKGLSDRLAAIDCKGGTVGTIDLVATIAGPQETELKYIGLGNFKFKTYTGTVKFVYKNQTAWESVQSNAPGMIRLQQGENIESHLRTLEKPNYEFFERVEFPKLLQKPVEGQGPGRSLTIGQSNVTVGGIR